MDSGEADQELSEIWDELQVRPDEKATAQSLEKVYQTIGIEHRTRKTAPTLILRKWSIRIAAILIPALALTGVFISTYNQPSDAVAEIEVPHGNTRLIQLPDGSRVWVNAGSTLRYPKRFGEERIVHLSGEAFFDVVRDTAKPFYVTCDDLKIKVLGTQFNLKNYPHEEALVTLKSGKIEVITQPGDRYTMNAGQQFSFEQNARISAVNDIDLNLRHADSWVDGCLVFNETKLCDIFSTLERRFDIKVNASPSILQNTNRYHVIFDREESLEHILSVLSYLDDTRFSFHIDGREVTVGNSTSNEVR